jgi:hypothetical protein
MKTNLSFRVDAAQRTLKIKCVFHYIINHEDIVFTISDSQQTFFKVNVFLVQNRKNRSITSSSRQPRVPLVSP